MEIGIIFARTVLMYFVVFLVMRLMGKREIGKLSVFDLVISIMIAEIAVFVIEDNDKPLIEGLVPLFTLVFIQILLAYLFLKHQTIRRWFDGNPSVLIRNGKLDREEMRRQKYNFDDLLQQLRSKDVTNLRDVEFAILETNGNLNVVKKNERPRDDENEVRTSIRYEGLPLALILDGKVQDKHLEMIGKNRFWLKQALREKGIRDFKDVFFCSIDHKGRLYIDKNDT